jgi:hypothetical protein
MPHVSRERKQRWLDQRPARRERQAVSKFFENYMLDGTRKQELREMSYEELVKWAGTSELRLKWAASARGYKPGWVWHRLKKEA